MAGLQREHKEDFDTATCAPCSTTVPVGPEGLILAQDSPGFTVLATAVAFFGDNDDSSAARGASRPDLLGEGGSIYGFGMESGGVERHVLHRGARPSRDVEGDDLQKNSRAAITVARPVGPDHSVKLYPYWGVHSYRHRFRHHRIGGSTLGGRL